MASSSSSSFSNNPSDHFNPLFLLSNITNLVPFKLDNSNYILWRYQISSVLRTFLLFGFVDGSTPSPSQFLCDAATGQVTNTVNPAYQSWLIQDQALITLLNATLTENVLAHVIGKTTSRQVWTCLEKQYSSLSRPYILQLKSDLHTITKKKSDSIDKYVQKIKKLRDKLSVFSVQIDDEDMLLYTLNGLPPEYDGFRTAIRTRSENLSLEELHALLKSEEQIIDYTLHSTYVQESAMASFNNRNGLFHSRPQNLQGYRRGNSFNRGRRRFGGRNNGFRGSFPHQFQNQFHNQFSSNSTNQPSSSQTRNFFKKPCVICQFCNKPNHSAIDCYNRMNYAFQGRLPPAQLSAMAATTYDSMKNSDSGASTLKSLSLAEPYTGNDNVSIGNGQGLPISHTGSSWQPNKSPVFKASSGGSLYNSTSPSTGFPFGASSANSIFSMTSAAANTSSLTPFSQTQPTFGNSTPVFTASSVNNDQMNMEDSMDEDPVLSTESVLQVFSQLSISPSSGIVFGSSAGIPFQFSSQQSQAAPQNPSPFASGSLDFSAGGSFSLGSSGRDNANWKIIRVKKNRKR